MNKPNVAPMKIACVGEAMVELSVDVAGRHANVGYAGDTLNTAIYLRRQLPSDHRVCFNTVIGLDQFSDNMLDYIHAEKIDCSHIDRHPEKLPGIYSISKDASGDRVFSYWRENSAARTLFCGVDGEANFSSLADMDVIYLSAITLAILPDDIVFSLFEWLRSFRKRGGRIVFDSNYRPRLWPDQKHAQNIVEEAWLLTDIALPSIDDEMALFGDVDEEAAINRLAGYDVPMMVIKRGEAGPIALIDGKLQSVDVSFPKADRVVDTTAAGDSFNGAFLASILNGCTLMDAMLNGHDMAVKVIGHQGAII